MRIDTTFLRSKVAQRIFILFICCALLPIIALAVLSFSQVTQQLGEQSQKQLHQMSKDIGMYIYERLLFLEAEMKMVASRIGSTRGVVFSMSVEEFDIDLEQHFKGFALINDKGTFKPLVGSIQNIPTLTQSEKQYLQAGKTVVSTMYYPGRPSRIFIIIALDPRKPRRRILLAEINPSYLWGITDENLWMQAAELCILDHSHHILFSMLPPPLSFPQEVVHAMDSNVSGQFEWKDKKNHYVASYWSLFLKERYYTPKWTVVLSESKADVLAPVATFKKTFPLVTLMTLWVVLLLSIIQIRRNLVPLERLKEGTKYIAQKNFNKRVIIKTGDEFEELAESFNAMADRLGKQFKTLSTITEIDRSILSALDTEKIIEVVLNRIHDVLTCDCVSVMLFNFSRQDAAVTYIREKRLEIGKEVETVPITLEEMKKLYLNHEFFVTEVNHAIPNYLASLVKRGNKSFLVLPFFINQILSGIITLGYHNPPIYDREDIAQVRQLADQVAVALSNTRLVEELEQLHLGTLTALARTIDAKSRWTAGHSERITKLALKIGGALGISPKELDTLRCAGLLHDIGKIGVPADILEKTGKLTDHEKQLIYEHVRLGARILEPIAAFAEIIPIVLQHHERFDGKGYPGGLAGEAIHLGARILAVADTFDALTSHRPYHLSVDRERAIETIKQEAGTQFDPRVVQAFLKVMVEEQKKKDIKIAIKK
jgi:putative nucleotidyltransferase with HDIG domain